MNMADLNTALPSYEEATTAIHPIALVAEYVRARDLFNCSLVSREWHDALEDGLWGEPAEFWELGHRNSLTGWLLFLDVLPIVAPETRSKVHTLSLERVLPSIYTSLPATWLTDLLILLPRLRTFVLPAIPFFDHTSILAKPSTKGPLPQQYLTHLDISQLTNTTSKSLVHLFSALTPLLQVLDLSGSNGANHVDTLNAIAQELKALKSLKLKYLKLTDQSVATLARGVGVRLERLDLTGNLLTDAVAGELLDWCFMPPEYEVGEEDDVDTIRGQLPVDDDFESGFADDDESWTTARKVDSSSRSRAKSLAQAPPDINGVQKPVETKGLTHLYISNNKISVSGVTQLLKSTRLRTFDCGMLHHIPSHPQVVSDLIPILSLYTFSTLRNLRIDHRLVCGQPTLNSTTVVTSSSSRTLTPNILPRLRSLALVDVPTTTNDPTLVQKLFTFMNSLATRPPHERAFSSGNPLETVTFELTDSQSDDIGLYAVTTPDHDDSAFYKASSKDFSFFDEPSVAGEGSGSWNEYTGNGSKGHSKAVAVEKNVIEEIRTWRKTDAGKEWKGTIRVIRDMGGSQSSERGVQGNRWGYVRDKV